MSCLFPSVQMSNGEAHLMKPHEQICFASLVLIIAAM